MYHQHTRGIVTTRNMSLAEKGGKEAFVRNKGLAHTQKKNQKNKACQQELIFTNIKKNGFKHIELPVKLLDYFLCSSKNNINQSCRALLILCSGTFLGGFRALGYRTFWRVCGALLSVQSALLCWALLSVCKAVLGAYKALEYWTFWREYVELPWVYRGLSCVGLFWVYTVHSALIRVPAYIHSALSSVYKTLLYRDFYQIVKYRAQPRLGFLTTFLWCCFQFSVKT